MLPKGTKAGIACIFLFLFACLTMIAKAYMEINDAVELGNRAAMVAVMGRDDPSAADRSKQ